MIAYKPGQKRRIRPEVGDSGSGAQEVATILRLYGQGQSAGEEGQEIASSREDKGGKMAKKKKLDQKEVSSNSKDFIKSHMFFLDLMLPIIKECPSPTTSSEATLILHGLIFKYEQLIATKMLEAEPYRTIFAKTKEFCDKTKNISGLCDGSADIFGLTSILSSTDLEDGRFGYDVNKIMPMTMSVYKKCLEFYKDDKQVVELIKKHSHTFSTLLYQIVIIQFYRHEKIQDFNTSLAYILRLAFAEGMKLADLYNANTIKDYMASTTGKENAEKINPELKAHYERAIKEADKRWKDGSKLTHGKMAKELCDEFNIEIKKKKIEEFQKKYPNRENDPAQMVLYNYDIDNVLLHHLMSSKMLTKLLEQTARKHGKYLNRREKGKKQE